LVQGVVLPQGSLRQKTSDIAIVLHTNLRASWRLSKQVSKARVVRIKEFYRLEDAAVMYQKHACTCCSIYFYMFFVCGVESLVPTARGRG
jgi:hypothetical protein